ncbi:hypothetical protein CVU37_07445 [candidate division BRC1 bacterium HGW-BRC1-1]|nr:MAG: hypothetical protein CVU37_07445 [candidate division BRC1 bacterium HGW-BRC1-1]
MRQEDIEVRITKKGEVFVTIHGATEQRLNDYRQFLEEMIGPITAFNRVDSPDWEKPAELASEEETSLEGENS